MNKITLSGGDNEGVTPVPIPNTEVKPFSADGTWLETARESRSLPDSNKLRCVAAEFFHCLKRRQPEDVSGRAGEWIPAGGLTPAAFESSLTGEGTGRR